jgi:hypothetical protein
MSTPLEQLTRQAFALSAEDRARLADLLLPSLPDGADEPLDETWDREIQQRVAAVGAGTAQLTIASDVHAQTRKIHQR